jgi:hypothetical protein
MITVTWSGMEDAICTTAVPPPPSWSFTIVTASCQPGTGGMIGTSSTTLPTGITSTLTENFAAVDEAPTGFVYVGGPSYLWRVPKAGGTAQDVEAAAGLATTQMGYELLAVGNQIFTIDDSTSTTGTTGRLWRISNDGGQTWSPQDFASFPVAPADDLRAMTTYGGKIYMMTHEASTTVGTDIWSVDLNPASLPATATLEATIDEHNCSAITADAGFFYVACGTDDRVVRVDRTTGVVTLVTTAFDLSTTKNAIHADDPDGDGTANFLYLKGSEEEVGFVCGPASAAPYADMLLPSFGTSTSTYGLALDAAANKLYVYDDGPKEFFVLQ